MKLLLATHNRGKVNDLNALLQDSDITVLSLDDVPDLPDVEEDGDTFLDNARKKAQACFGHCGIPTLADDSGLMVDALDGAPGVYSARYGGEPSNDEKNKAKLLEELKDFPLDRQRSAKFVCVLVFIGEEGHESVVVGEAKGHITHEPKGTNGFGYDPLFVHPAYNGKTMGEVSQQEKNAVSHRGAAMRDMLPKILAFSKSKR